jgi:hypothetical protein
MSVTDVRATFAFDSSLSQRFFSVNRVQIAPNRCRAWVDQNNFHRKIALAWNDKTDRGERCN